MKPSERDELARETHQALLGIKGTEDNGLVGDVRELKRDVRQLQNERRSPSKKTIGAYVGGTVTLLATMWKAFLGS